MRRKKLIATNAMIVAERARLSLQIGATSQPLRKRRQQALPVASCVSQKGRLTWCERAVLYVLGDLRSVERLNMHSRATTTVVNNALEKRRREFVPGLRGVQKRGAEIHKEVARELCPKSNIEHVHLFETIEEKQIDENTREVSAGDDGHKYAATLEEGGENTEAQPYFEPARQEARRWMNQEYKRL